MTTSEWRGGKQVIPSKRVGGGGQVERRSSSRSGSGNNAKEALPPPSAENYDAAAPLDGNKGTYST